MNRLIFVLISIIAISISVQAQINTLKYSDVDSLFSSNSMVNNMKALNLLKSKYISDTIKSDYWIKYSLACYNSYKYTEAFNSIDKAIYIDNKNSHAYFEKAKLIMDIKNNISEAINLLNIAIKYNKNGEFYFYRGIYHQMSDSISKAISDYDNAAQLDFEHQGLFRNYSILLLKSDLPEKALVYINKGIELNTEIPDNYKTRGEIYTLLVEPEKACADFEKARLKGYRKSIDFAEIICSTNYSKNKFSSTGQILLKLEKYNFAIKAFDKAIELEKDSSRHYLNRGFCFFKLGNYKNAEQDYLKALALPESSTDMLYDNLSLLYFEQNNFEKSLEYSAKRIKINPGNFVAYIDRGLSYRKLKKYKQAEKDFDTSLKIKPDFFRALGYRAFLFLELRQYQKSYDDASRAIKINPEYGYASLVLAQAKQMLYIPDFCIDYYNAKKYGEEKEAEKGINEFCK